ncbi:MAG: hypothetical protein EBU90_16010 [Proteobacteria bacterium]|nr:hypothetical protein [Pseudomonadota bacterium]NBP15239.1 hypothetical protein [bacterium]
MPTKTWIATTAGATWGTAANWSPSGVPAAGDDVIFNSASGGCTVSANTNALLSLNCTGYTNTLTINTGINIIVAGNVILSSGMTTTTSGTGGITMNTGTLTTAGHQLGVWLRMTTINSTIQLADNCVLLKGLAVLGTPVGNITLRSDTPGTARLLTLSNIAGVDQDIDYATVIDIDSSQGLTFWNYKGTIGSNVSNWQIMQQYELRLSGLVFA